MTLDQDTANSILLYAITAAGAVFTAIWLALIIWTWRDMRQRSRDPLAAVAAGMLAAVLGVFGVIIHVMLRPSETLSEAYERSLEEEALLQNIEDKPICPGCGRLTQDDWQVCPYCHTKLKKLCVNCDRMLELAWNLCPYCAASQVPYDAGQPAAPQPRRQADQSQPAAGSRRSIAAQLGSTPDPPPDYDYTVGEEEEVVEFVDEDSPY
jgi:RNA polymerase subunit RPABC4/transcription elongation factor Spt4